MHWQDTPVGGVRETTCLRGWVRGADAGLVGHVRPRESMDDAGDQPPLSALKV